jgi:hypothetical protein
MLVFCKSSIQPDSFYSFQQKIAAFNSTAHLLTNILMTIENYKEEKNFIVELGRNNEYKDQENKNIIHRTRYLTTHLLEPEKKSIRNMYVQYYPKITNTLSKTLKKHNIQLTTNSNIYKLRIQIKFTKN